MMMMMFKSKFNETTSVSMMLMKKQLVVKLSVQMLQGRYNTLVYNRFIKSGKLGREMIWFRYEKCGATGEPVNELWEKQIWLNLVIRNRMKPASWVPSIHLPYFLSMKIPSAHLVPVFILVWCILFLLVILVFSINIFSTVPLIFTIKI